MPGHLSELQPVNAVNTKGQFLRASFGKNPRFQIQLDKRPLSPGTSREASGVPCLNPRRGLTLLGLHSRRTRGDRHSSRVEAKNPALLSNRDGYLLELTGWTQGSQASLGLWREAARGSS